MKRASFIGREQELSLLRGIKYQEKSAITAIYGRRRIGKTSLVENAFNEKNLIKFEGLEDQDEQTQREHFRATLALHSGKAEHRRVDVTNWTNLLITLSEYIGDKPSVVFLDEYQWLSAEKTNLTSYLKYVWDNYFLTKNKVHLIICGSVSSFIVKKVIRSKALYGRIDSFIELKELSLPQTITNFLQEQSHPRKALDYYLAVGGIPKYLELYKKSLSFEQNIEQLFFRKSGYLFSETERLFVSHFGSNRVYKEIIEALAHQSHASQKEIAKKAKLSSGGRLSEYLEDLELAGFIESYYPLHNPNSNYLKRYRVRDAYLRFYYRFVNPFRKQIESAKRELRFDQVIQHQQYNVWKGQSFEQCCLDHSHLIAKLLGFSAVRYVVGSWYMKRDLKDGFQIDMVYQRQDRVITLCEVKYRRTLTKDIFAEIAQKEERLFEEAQPDSIQRVLISVFEPSKEFLAQEHFSEVILLDDILKAPEG